MFIIVLFSIGIVGFAVCMMLMREHFQKLVDIEYLEFHNKWIEDGRPAGGRVTLSEQNFFLSGFSPSLVLVQWMFSTPRWAKGHTAAEFHLRKMKQWFLFSIPMWLCVAGAFLLAVDQL